MVSQQAKQAISMEASASAAGTTTTTTTKSKTLSKQTSSFRLRCPSLNSLRLRRIFDLFDKNGDGMITVDELSQALNLLGLDSDLYDLLPVVNSFIKPGNEGLRFDDFESLHRSLNETYFGIEENEGGEEAGGHGGATTMLLCGGGGGGGGGHDASSQEESDLSEAFKVFDKDGDGFISAEELQVVLAKLGLAEGSEIGSVQKMIVSVDRNRDGRVDFFEFKDMMRSVIVPSS